VVVPQASLRARLADLLGEDPFAPPSTRPTLAEALVACEPGSVMAATDNGADVAVVALPNGRRFVVPDACPHDGGLLSNGFVEGDRLVCARHNWEFDPETGSCDGKPRIRLESRPCPALKACEPRAGRRPGHVKPRRS
jgi:nitrite reductase/ring-hydroxylating ferredoxin subunit